jgi:hypothetical protein
MAKKAAGTKKAVKKATTKKAAPKKAAAKKAAVKKTGVKKAAPKKAGVKKAAVKKAAPRLNDKSRELLTKVIGAGEGGYGGEKGEDRALKGLVTRKLLKTSRDKATKAVSYHVTKAGSKAMA